ncbi:hypothetical protein [Actinoplanes palleronii]|uniref:Uncharacterized protein n=1 Tax=Actinoplanes palleronii TaxID=113570 RepID=A0ABQ4B0W8_9ACTN|nr:hypothetical protein [Actinoplanes palleronii]GIE64312.1 hypothetical protein Apa02nite_004200 [Actinoplanes palleronii]
MTLTPCTDLSAARWLMDDPQPWGFQLLTVGPAGFPAYARLRFLPEPEYPGPDAADVADEVPSETEQLRTVLTVLAGHTTTPDACWFALWDGWGSDIHGSATVAPAFPPEVLDGPRLQLWGRAYYLFCGALTDFGDWGGAEMWPGQPRFAMPDPGFIWPADRAWCVANDVDPPWAGLSGSVPAVDEVVALAGVDVVRVDPERDRPGDG